MAGLGSIIRQWLDLLEAIQAPWGLSKASLFDESKQKMLAKRPDLEDRLARFLSIKLPNPLSRDAVYGKNDTAFTLMPGYWHCHLAPDAVLIYRLINHSIELVYLCHHADFEGKRIRALGRKLAA